MKKIKAIVFDLGGTLVERKKRAYGVLKKKFNFEIDSKTLGKAEGEIFNKNVWVNIDKGIEKFARICKRPNDVVFKKYVKKLILSRGDSHKRYKDTKKILLELRKKKYKVALLTNWNQYCLDVLDYHGIKKYFHHIVISSHERIRKPDPRIFKIVLKHLNIKPNEALMVGDNYEKDFVGAKKIGMHAVLIERRGKKHDHSIRDLRGVINYIRQINGLL